jgi:hypothetical protein
MPRKRHLLFLAVFLGTSALAPPQASAARSISAPGLAISAVPGPDGQYDPAKARCQSGLIVPSGWGLLSDPTQAACKNGFIVPNGEQGCPDDLLNASGGVDDPTEALCAGTDLSCPADIVPPLWLVRSIHTTAPMLHAIPGTPNSAERCAPNDSENDNTRTSKSRLTFKDDRVQPPPRNPWVTSVAREAALAQDEWNVGKGILGHR